MGECRLCRYYRDGEGCIADWAYGEEPPSGVPGWCPKRDDVDEFYEEE